MERRPGMKFEQIGKYQRHKNVKLMSINEMIAVHDKAKTDRFTKIQIVRKKNES